MLRTLDRIDRYIAAQGLPAAPADPASRMPLRASGGGGTIDLDRDGIRSVVWATGYVRRYPWLHAPVLDSRGEIIHDGGVTPLPGLYVLGLTFQRRRRSHFIDGCGYDADDLAPMLRRHLEEHGDAGGVTDHARPAIDDAEKIGAGEGIRTLDPDLGKVVLYP